MLIIITNDTGIVILLSKFREGKIIYARAEFRCGMIINENKIGEKFSPINWKISTNRRNLFIYSRYFIDFIAQISRYYS